MFDNIGKKIKIIAWGILFIWIIIGIVSGIGVGSMAEDTFTMYFGGPFLGTLIGFLIGMINAFIIYAIGDIAEKLENINGKICSSSHNEQNKNSSEQ